MRKVVIILIALVLGITPLLTQGNLYFVGGDDMRLYYVYPKEYIQNLLLNIVTDNTIGGGNTGYYPATHPIPLVALMLVVKTLLPFLNTQFVMYGLNWALAFIFLYLLLGLWISNQSKTIFFIRIAASLFYIFSPFLFRTFYKHQMIVIYLIAAAPATLYFFIKSVRQRNFLYVFTACLILTFLSTNLSSLPWTIPILITSAPLLLWEFLRSKKVFLLNGLLFGTSYVLINFSWIFHLFYLNFHKTGLANTVDTYTSEGFIEANIAGIRGTTTMFSPLNGVINQLEIGLVDKLTVVSYTNLLFISLIVLAGVFIHREKNNVLTMGFILGLLGLLISWFLMTPNFQHWGPDLFIWLSLRVPFFTMFRNMFDKFALTTALYYALTLGIGLSILANRFTNKIVRLVIGAGLIITILVNAYPLFQARVEHVGVQAKMSGTFNDDFNNLAAYLSDLKNPSRILWLPLNYPSFTNIEDKYHPGHFYSGPSPLRFLSNRQDYAGQYSFITSTNIAIGDSIFPGLRDRKYIEFGRMVQLLNARYVILDKQSLPESMTSYLYGGDNRVVLKWQTAEFINGLLGKKLQDFGTRYTLYEINPKYNNDRIYLTDDYDVFPRALPNADYEKISDSLYKVSLSNIKKPQKIVFLDSYYRDWTLYIEGPEPRAYHKGQNVPVQNFANGWEIDPGEIKNNFPEAYYTTNPDGSLNLKMSLYFEPAKYNRPIRNISLGSFLVLACSQLFFLVKKNHAKA
ncbi:MAG: Uncharacterized protein G01um101416_58 [Microgenomates group bacterium Gr01-1014_16]|nr:MAG: Uncharacterized protein G01um101416_58 [Microgenomates group bacterium Gr01-1014_16]